MAAVTWWDQAAGARPGIAPPPAAPSPGAALPRPPAAAPPPGTRNPAGPTPPQSPPPAAAAPTQFDEPNSPNNPANKGNGKAANAYLLSILNGGFKGTDYGALVNDLNQQFGLPSGSGLQWYPDKKVIAAAGGGYYAAGADGKWGYNVGDSQGGGKTQIDPGTLGSLLQPFGDAPPGFSLPGYKTPDPFVAPNGDDVLKDKGYLFRLGQGEQTVENSASAKGLLNSGGTLKDILNYGQNAASQEYQNVYTRALGTYQTNVQSQNLDPYKFAYQQGLDTNNLNWNQYLQKYAQFRNQQLDTYNKLYGFASLGAQTAGA